RRLRTIEIHLNPTKEIIDRALAAETFDGTVVVAFDADSGVMRLEEKDTRDLTELFATVDTSDYIASSQALNQKNRITLFKQEHVAALDIIPDVVVVYPPAPSVRNHWKFIAFGLTTDWSTWSDRTIGGAPDGKINIQGKSKGKEF